MAIDDDGSSEAVGAEKNPRNVRRFVWGLLAGVFNLLAVLLMSPKLSYIHCSIGFDL